MHLHYFLSYLSEKLGHSDETTLKCVYDGYIKQFMPEDSGPGYYGRNKSEACIYGKQCILIDIDRVASVINQNLGTLVFNPSELYVDSESNFVNSLDVPMKPDNLVLAPYGFRTRFYLNNFTVFNKEEMERRYPGFSCLSQCR